MKSQTQVFNNAPEVSPFILEHTETLNFEKSDQIETEYQTTQLRKFKSQLNYDYSSINKNPFKVAQ